MNRYISLIITFVSIIAMISLPGEAAPSAKKSNVILFIADGAGFATFSAAADYQTGSPTGLPYMSKPWKLYSCSTYSIAGDYDPDEMWSSFKKQLSNATDSAAAATAINTGVKTDNGSLGMDDDQEWVETFAEMAAKKGFACGSVTSVQVAHATPGGVAGHVDSRREGSRIFEQSLYSGALSVMIGCGHPQYDRQGNLATGDALSRKSSDDYYFSADGQKHFLEFNVFGPSKRQWEKIQKGELPESWEFIEAREDFQRIAKDPGEAPKKLLGIARSHVSFTYDDRNKERQVIPTVPTLAEASLAALNVLNQNRKGFYLMIEGGAVDTCNHTNNLPGMLVEMREFNAAIAAVCDWVEKNSSWEETLVIITSDHETGALWGPNADKSDSLFQTIQFNGKGVLPTYKYYYGNHTNQLVPVYVRGKDAALFEKCIRGTDPFFGKLWNYDGRYIDNTDFIQVMTYVMGL